MHPKTHLWLLFIGISISLISCSKKDETSTPDNGYTGTASVTQGPASVTTSNLYPGGQRVAGLGTIQSDDGKSWTVPAEVNFEDSSFPTAPDLYNPDGKKYNTSAEALADFKNSDIIEIDASGDIITGFIFADNYFELYVNGIPVGKDAIPFTPFNSHIVQFRVAFVDIL